MKIKVWTSHYSPFMMGGDVHTPWMTEVDATDSFPIGKGYTARLIVSPKGKVYVVEDGTGGIVGTSLEQVKEDIASASKKDIEEQLIREERRSKQARYVEPEKFWLGLEGKIL